MESKKKTSLEGVNNQADIVPSNSTCQDEKQIPAVTLSETVPEIVFSEKDRTDEAHAVSHCVVSAPMAQRIEVFKGSPNTLPTIVHQDSSFENSLISNHLSSNAQGEGTLPKENVNSNSNANAGVSAVSEIGEKEIAAACSIPTITPYPSQTPDMLSLEKNVFLCSTTEFSESSSNTFLVSILTEFKLKGDERGDEETMEADADAEIERMNVYFSLFSPPSHFFHQ